MKQKLIEVRADKKIIGVKINKREWKNLIASITEFILILITILAVSLLILCPIGMVNTWSITPAHLITIFSSLAWLGLMWIYSRIVNK